MKKTKAGLRWKIFAYMLGFCLLLLVILWLFQTVFLESFYRAVKLSEIEKQAAVLADYVRRGDMEALEAAVRQRGDMIVELVDAQGNSTLMQAGFPEGELHRYSLDQKKDLYTLAQQNGGAVTLDPNAPHSPNWQTDKSVMPVPGQGQNPAFSPGPLMRENILYAEIVKTNDGEQPLLLLNAALTPVAATVQTLRIQLVYISGIMLALAVLIAVLLARHVSKPIIGLNDAAKHLATGEEEARFSGKGYREIEELAETLNRASEELAKTEALRRELIANVSHDLRTPLTLIAGYAEMMRDIPGEDSRENMQVIIDESKRLSALVEDLLDLSRVQSKTVEMHFETFSITQEIEQIIERLKKFSAPEGFVIRFEKSADVEVYADPTRISQVVYNFLVNAMNYSADEKEIVVRQHLRKGAVRIEVVDRGEGIKPEDLPYIWERYYKIDKVHRRAAAGSGLGLSIVKNILKQHPGVTYGVQSGKGHGSTFWFELPTAT